jgi:V-type H+-transporting ATPase subunit a
VPVCQITHLEKWHTPPTYFRVNKITDSFQTIVNTYGYPRYKEVNPGLFTIFTFPFLFGVMYGDIGHGTLLTLASLYMIWKEADIQRQIARKQFGEIQSMAFAGRYLLVGMGICAVYCGIMYNDCFSIPWNTFGSVWTFPDREVGATTVEAFKSGTVYPIGIDPNWYGVVNELTFFNSFKMKLSVTIGVTHVRRSRRSCALLPALLLDLCVLTCSTLSALLCLVCADDFRLVSAGVQPHIQ